MRSAAAARGTSFDAEREAIRESIPLGRQGQRGLADVSSGPANCWLGKGVVSPAAG